MTAVLGFAVLFLFYISQNAKFNLVGAIHRVLLIGILIFINPFAYGWIRPVLGFIHPLFAGLTMLACLAVTVLIFARVYQERGFGLGRRIMRRISNIEQCLFKRTPQPCHSEQSEAISDVPFKSPGIAQSVPNETTNLQTPCNDKTEQPLAANSSSKSEKKKEVVLTFDDGPSPQWTPKILSVLKETGVPAVFFVVGKHVEKHPEILRNVKGAGMEIAVHSYRHVPLVLLKSEMIREELEKTVRIIEEAAGMKPKFFRPPWGLYNGEILEAALSLGLTTILWSRSSLDWMGIPASEVKRNSLMNIKSGEILLFHDGHRDGINRKGTAEALPGIIDQLKKDGFEFIKLS